MINNSGNEYGRTVPRNILESIVSAKEYIDENPASSISICEIARMAGLNRTYFCRYFKLVTGRTFKESLIEIKLETAKKLLKGESLLISEVAREVGYSPKKFSETFKRVVGISPREYRNQKLTNREVYLTKRGSI